MVPGRNAKLAGIGSDHGKALILLMMSGFSRVDSFTINALGYGVP